jgi:hypothetical protein
MNEATAATAKVTKPPDPKRWDSSGSSFMVHLHKGPACAAEEAQTHVAYIGLDRGLAAAAKVGELPGEGTDRFHLGLRPQRLRPRHFRLCRLLDLRFLRRLGLRAWSVLAELP